MTDQTKPWLDSWEGDITPWHLDSVHKSLQRHIERLTGPNKTIFIPMCGKSVDMKWLGDNGWSVVGLEISEKGVKQFLEKHGISYVVNSMVSVENGKVFCSTDNKYRIYCCDILAVDPTKELNHAVVDAVWDRGALGAIDIPCRPKYVEVMNAYLAPDTKYLLELVDRGHTETPPYPMSVDEIENVFGKRFKVEELERLGLEDMPMKDSPVDVGNVKGAIIYFMTCS